MSDSKKHGTLEIADWTEESDAAPEEVVTPETVGDFASQIPHVSVGESIDKNEPTAPAATTTSGLFSRPDMGELISLGGGIRVTLSTRSRLSLLSEPATSPGRRVEDVYVDEGRRRVPIEGGAEVLPASTDKHIEAALCDGSYQGAFIAMDAAFAVDDTFSIRLDQLEHWVQAKVVWAGKKDGRRGVGVTLTFGSDADASAWRRFLNTQKP